MSECVCVVVVVVVAGVVVAAAVAVAIVVAALDCGEGSLGALYFPFSSQSTFLDRSSKQTLWNSGTSA